ncbi:DUF3298 domain-containing protein [Paenibacillus piri]|nr:DUF3298 domain-containing protein [Paenibacillus piri]
MKNPFNPFKMLTLTITGCCLLTAAAPISYADALPPVSAPSAGVPVPISAPINQQQGIQVAGKTVKEQTADFEADITYPVIGGMLDKAYQTKLNDQIAGRAMEDLDNLKKEAADAAAKAKEAGFEHRPHTLSIKYEVTADGSASAANIVSIKVDTYTFTGGANGMPRVDTYNALNKTQAKQAELNELFGSGYKDTINERIRQEIAKQPDRYFKGDEGFKGISDTQSFYMEKEAAVIVFQKYEIAPGSSGNPEFRIPLATGSGTAQTGVKISTKTVKNEDGLVAVNMNIPVFEGLKDSKYQAQLNDIIESGAMKDMESLKTQAQEGAAAAQEAGQKMRPYTLDVMYEVKADGGGANANLVSVKIVTGVYTGGAHGMPRVNTYTVLDEAEAKSVQLKNLFGDGYKETVNEQIRQEIAKHPDKYFKDGFKGISDTQSFYVEKGAAVIVFGAYEIAPYAAGTPEFRIPFSQPSRPASPSRLVVSGSELSVGDAAIYINDSGMTLAPLRAIAERLGWNVKWNGETQSAEISKGAQWTSLQTGKDAYIYNKMAPFSLGQAPVIKEDGIMYVPLDFFSRVLKASVITEAGIIGIQ